jgi:hypothetical protein
MSFDFDTMMLQSSILFHGLKKKFGISERIDHKRKVIINKDSDIDPF